MLSPSRVVSKVFDLEASHAQRDARHARVAAVRGGDLASVFPTLFGPEDDSPLVANYIDVVARDMAEMIAPLPALNCMSGTITSDRARKFAAKRQKIGFHYWLYSNLRLTLPGAVDRYLTYGYVPMKIEPVFAAKMPRIRFLDPRHGYPEFDHAGDTVSFTQKSRVKASKLAALYPQFAATIIRNDSKSPMTGNQVDQELTVFTYEDGDQTLVFVQERNNLVLESYPNRLGECSVKCIVRPSPDSQIRGQFDDVLGALASKAYLARLRMEAAEKTVQAPIVAPDDALEIPLGPDAIIRTQNPQGVGRLRLDTGNGALLEGQVLDQELKFGTRYPDARSGQISGQIVTGRGVEALLGTFDTQVKTHQTVFGEGLRRGTMVCFKLDEIYWKNVRKEIRGTAEGVPFSDTYTPGKDIDGDYTCDVTYGMLAGMDPNRALIFLLQAQGAGLLDRATSMKQMPFDIDVTQLQQNIEVERMRDAGLAGLQATVQAIGPIVEQGGDATQLLTSLAAAIKDRQNGKPIEEALMRFAPPPPSPEDQAAAQAGGPGGDLPPGVQPSGLLSGVAPGQAGQPPGGRPALNQLLASLTQSGKPNLQAAVRRSLPIPGG